MTERPSSGLDLAKQCVQTRMSVKGASALITHNLQLTGIFIRYKNSFLPRKRVYLKDNTGLHL